MHTDNDILRVMDNHWTEAIQLWQQWWYEADLDTRMTIGDQNLFTYFYNTQPFRLQNQLYFNKIRKLRNMISGHQRRNRKTSICVPVENSDQETADQFSKLLLWSMNNNNTFNTLSDAFEGAVTCGLNLLSVWMDYRDDPISGDIKCDNFNYSGFIIDPYFKKQDLSDCNYIWTRRWFSKKQIISLFPDMEKDIEAMGYQAYKDGKFAFMPENFQYSLKKLLPYDEYWYHDLRDSTMLVESNTGESMEFKGTDENLKKFLSMYPQIQVVKGQKQTVRLAIVVNGVPFYNGAHPWGIDKYPFVPVIGYQENATQFFPWKWQGITRGLRDAQFTYNRRRRIELDILESQVNSGLKIVEDSLVNPEDAYLTGQGRVLWLKKGNPITNVEKEQPAQIPPSMFQMTEMLDKDILDISGVTEELLGMAQGDKVGIVEMLRQSAGLTTLQPLFDPLDLSQKLLGQLYIDLMQANFSEGKVRRILGQEPTRQFRDKTFQKYDCNVEEGMLTTSQKQMQFAQLLQLQEIGIPVPPALLLETTTLQRKKELVAAIEKQQKQAEQVQQMQQQLEMQNQATVTEGIKSKAESDRALAQERIAKISLDKALNMERIARAQEDRDAGTLDRIKAIKELGDIDLGQIERLVGILQSIQLEQVGEANQNMQPQEAA